MKQDREQKAFKDAIDEARRLWNTGSMSINQAAKLAAKKHKVNADELARYVFEYTKNKTKVNNGLNYRSGAKANREQEFQLILGKF